MARLRSATRSRAPARRPWGRLCRVPEARLFPLPPSPISRRPPDDGPFGKGMSCAQARGFNLQATTRVAINDKPGRERLCRCLLRPTPANDRFSVLDGGSVGIAFKQPWSDGTSAVQMHPLALIARLAALVPPPRRHLTRYVVLLSSYGKLRSQVAPKPATEQDSSNAKNPAGNSRYIPWAELLRRTFAIEIKCGKCGSRLCLVTLVKTESVGRKILVAMHLRVEAPEPPRTAPSAASPGCGGRGTGKLARPTKRRTDALGCTTLRAGSVPLRPAAQPELAVPSPRHGPSARQEARVPASRRKVLAVAGTVPIRLRALGFPQHRF
jgi:hypothetical protein